jgi:hypothetical protein
MNDYQGWLTPALHLPFSKARPAREFDCGRERFIYFAWGQERPRIAKT